MKKITIFLILLMFASCIGKKRILVVNHSDLPRPVGPYSHSTSFKGVIFISGQLGIDPKTNTLKQGLEEQTIQIFENVNAILKDNHSGFEHILKANLFVKDIKQFSLVNRIYASYFPNHFPARSTIQVAALPMDAEIEIEFIAVRNS